MPTKLFCHLSFVFFLFACTNPFANQQLSMTADPGVTEAWISLHVDGVKSGADYIVQRDGKAVFKGRLQSPDTVVYDSLLKPATTYTYRFFAREHGDDSPALQSSLTTLDTTSHNFSWQSYEFGGQKGSSYFQDVAIIDENDIWAVGEIYTEDTYTYDSLGNFIQPYNAAHWDGVKWELKRIPYYAENGYVYISPIYSIFAFSSNDIWFEGGIHWDGTKYNSLRMNINFPSHVNKIWGTSDNDLYVVGNSGMIAHYDGKGWTKIESGTDLPIMDIHGYRAESGKFEILCVAEDYGTPGGSKILSVQNNTVRELSTNGLLSYGLWGVWFMPNCKYIAVGDGLWETHSSDGIWVRNKSLPTLFKTAIAGKDLNDIVVCGAFWLLAHWNGVSWKTYFPRTSGSFTAVQIKHNLIIAVGGIENKAVVVSGRR